MLQNIVRCVALFVFGYSFYVIARVNTLAAQAFGWHFMYLTIVSLCLTIVTLSVLLLTQGRRELTSLRHALLGLCFPVSIRHCIHTYDTHSVLGGNCSVSHVFYIDFYQSRLA
jgi:uncharacterized membrane protein